MSSEKLKLNSKQLLCMLERVYKRNSFYKLQNSYNFSCITKTHITSLTIQIVELSVSYFTESNALLS